MAREKLYKNRTLQERLVLFLTKIGFVQIESRNKYIMMHKKTPALDKNLDGTDLLQDRYLFIGKNGAVRLNINSKSASDSRSVTDQMKAKLERYEKQEGLIV